NSKTAKQQNSKTAKQQNSKTAKQQNSKTAKQQNSKTAKQQNSKTDQNHCNSNPATQLTQFAERNAVAACAAPTLGQPAITDQSRNKSGNGCLLASTAY
ncbi:hypothetical protein, partial [Lysobacter sp. CA196]|uniref:hypothetical protein n=1 Tax=Lysobacter sp. CA196 TaxID=3455606 RepID=UPI003F8D18C3